jgi:methionyl aminopeptidase
MFVLKSPDEIDRMERAGQVVAKVLEAIRSLIRPGITTAEIDHLARRILKEEGALPSFLNYGDPPYPAAVCVSIDSEVVHGIPSEDRVVREGSIVSVDVGACLDGWHGDAARTYLVGDVTPEIRRLVDTAEACFWKAVEVAIPGNRVGDVSFAVQRCAEASGYGIVRVLTGHGIGQHLHEEPDVPNYGRPGRGTRLVEGMVLAIEPMINLGTGDVVLHDDGWTVETSDGCPSAHYENTVAITANGPRVLTMPRKNVLPGGYEVVRRA